MDLVADIGNTRCHLAAFEQGALVAKTATVGVAPEEWERFVAALPSRPRRAGVSSVNARTKEPFVAWARQAGLEALVVRESLAVRLVLDVAEPGKVGSDRLVNALWAARRSAGSAAVVADLGTAISFAVVDSKGVFRGGAIAPGVSTQARALHEKTALLPLVSVKRPASVLGRTTSECIEAGVFFGAAALVDRIVEETESALGEKARVFATGGDAALIAPASRRVERVVPDLTLEGVAIALAEAAV